MEPVPARGRKPLFPMTLGRGESLPQGSRSLQIQAEKVRDYILGNQATWIAVIGLETGLFKTLSDRTKKGVSADALSKDRGFDLGAVRAWCRSAYAYGFLEWEEESGYRLGPHMEELLLKPDHPAYQGGQIDANMERLLQYHKENGNDATILGIIRNVEIPYGVLKTKMADVEDIIEKPEYHFVINSGIYILEPRLIDLIAEGQRIDMPELLLKARREGFKVQSYPMTCSWFDVGQWGEYKRAIQHMSSLEIEH